MKKEKPFNFKWYDFLAAGVIPGIMMYFSFLQILSLSGRITITIVLIFLYLFFLGIIWFLNRHPKIAKDISKGSR